MNFKFTNEYSTGKLDEIVSYLLGPRLWIPKVDYPDFYDWADRSYRELKRENKRAMVALSYNDVVGVVIYQRHKKCRDTLEIKNLTVRPDKRGRYIASFLLRNAEIEGKREHKSNSVLCDAKAGNAEISGFLTRNGYKAIAECDLYCLDAGKDVIYKKNLSRFNTFH